MHVKFHTGLYSFSIHSIAEFSHIEITMKNIQIFYKMLLCKEFWNITKERQFSENCSNLKTKQAVDMKCRNAGDISF